MSHPRVLDKNESLLVVIDVQEGYRDRTFEHGRMVHGVCRLIQAAAVMGVPVLATEQYPKGLGHTQHEVSHCFPPETAVLEKRSLSCYQQPDFAARIVGWNRRQVLLCGIELHACVSQTAHDLLQRGFQVHIAHDAVSSRFETDYRIGWEKLVGSGVVPTTVEMACLEWVRTADAPEFKAIQGIVK